MFEVKVTFEAGETLKALMSGFMQPVAIEKPVAVEKPVTTPKAVVEKPVTTPKAAVEKPQAPKGKPSFEELDDDAKL